LINKRNHRVHILHNLEGLVRPGELLVVQGRPGSGCSTFLKTICGETHGITLDPNSEFNYHGIPFKDMHSQFQGEVVYTAEQDVHFPQLSVGVTLEFAALARTPRHPPGNIDRRAWAKHIRDVYMAIFGISHTVNTKVGNEYVRGVSGGERKRVSIAEAALGGSPFQCWDNSTRGLDSANAIEFCKTLRMASRLVGMTEAVAIYQAPQTAYKQFDKVLVLYQGRQIFFGPAARARPYFVRLGFHSPERQTTPDFLTSMTSSTERRVRPGFENRAPRTPDEFAQAWTLSLERTQLLKEIDEYNNDHPLGGPDFENFRKSIRLQKTNSQSSKSPFIISYAQQVRLCLWRGFERVRADPELQITQIVGQALAMLIISSLYFQLKPDTGAFFSRGSLIFFATLTNAFSSQLEMMSLYAQRPIVEKHARYALYRPSAEALASMLTGLPSKFLNSILFNIILYFMTGLRLTPGAFFFFFLTSFLTMLVMSSMFRTIASVFSTLDEAIVPGTIVTIGLVIYSGFPMPTPYMHGWARWINWVDPIAYGFEALMINEFHDRNFNCSTFIPTGPGYSQNSSSRACSAVGSVAGQTWVSGDAYLESSFQYSHSHKWRNIGVLIAFWIVLTAIYLAATDFIPAKKSKGEVLVFPRRKIPQHLRLSTNDIESGQEKSDNEGITSKRLPEKSPGDLEVGILRQTATFQWQDVSYEIKIKGKPRLILDRVDGWVRPGTLTGEIRIYGSTFLSDSFLTKIPIALMGVSGAGKTTLLDVLASRVTMGVIYGTVLVDGKQRDDSFQRKTGYAQQQDLHLETSTVREALNFSALLRQPDRYSRSEKLAYVDQVIQLLEMEDIADAVIGVPGEGISITRWKFQRCDCLLILWQD
jgi:ABC-type multidrug transport system ATPase subunit/ABC-type multidrug transport system permease subunit